METRKFDGGRVVDGPDAVAVEHNLTVRFGERALGTLACTPDNLEELVAGFMVSQGWFPALTEPQEAGFACVFSPDLRLATVGGGWAGECRSVEAGPVVWNGVVDRRRLGLLADLLQDSPLFRLTGGTHSALAVPVEQGLIAGAGDAGAGGETFRPEGVIRREDIGRHNAVDKVIGHLWLSGLLGRPYIMLTSGRISSDLVLKAARGGFPVVVSLGAPTELAVELAREFGVTLGGFARGRRLNVYSGVERVAD